MKNEFALAVENSTASFISKDNLICGNAVDEIAENLPGGFYYTLFLRKNQPHPHPLL